MHCLSRTILSNQRHHVLRIDYCSSVISAASNPAARSPPSVFLIGRLTCTQSSPICTFLHSKAHSYQHFCRRPGVSFMDPGPEFSTNHLSETVEFTNADLTNNDESQNRSRGLDFSTNHISETAEFTDADVTNNDESKNSSPGLNVEHESVNLISSEVAVGSGDSRRGENSVADVEDWAGLTENYGKRVLPEELARSVMKLTCQSTAPGGDGVCDVYLVGTAHVSTESSKLVEAVIRSLQPQVVFLELCSSRVNILQPQNLKVPTMREMMDMWKKNQNPFGILYSWFLAKVASQLEVFPGAEFKVGYEEAMKYGGKVILGDRPVQITLRRTWAKMPLWHKTKLLSSLLFQAFSLPTPEDLTKMIKEMDDNDMLTLVVQEMSKQFPTLMETLVHERDRYMSSTLLRIASEHTSVVAVVGKGHLPGIKKYWNQPVEIKELLTIPTKKPVISVRKIFTTVGVAVVGVAIVSGLYLSSRK